MSYSASEYLAVQIEHEITEKLTCSIVSVSFNMVLNLKTEVRKRNGNLEFDVELEQRLSKEFLKIQSIKTLLRENGVFLVRD